MKYPIGKQRLALLCLLALGLGMSLPGQAVIRPSQQPSGTAIADQPGSQMRAGEDYAAEEVLVTFKSGTSASARSDLARSMGDRMGQALENRPDIAPVKVKSGASVPEAVQAYEADPRVAHAQPNFIYHAQATRPGDNKYGQLWGLENTGQQVDGVSGTAGKDVAAPAAWDHQTDCSGVPVAVLDTGINYKHADLANNMWGGDTNHGRDFAGTNDGDPIPDGGQQHGTHVAGTIAAVGDNGTGTSGVCWNAKIMAVRVLGPDGAGYTADVIEGIGYAVNEGAKVINMSLGGAPYDQNYKDALKRARDNGVLVVAAAGNGGSDNVGDDNDTNPHYPSSYDLNNIIAVAALNQDYGLASFSNYGANSVDVGAPGTNILSAWPGSATSYPDLTLWQVSTADTDDWAVDTSGSSPWGGDALGYPNGFYGNQGYANSQDDWIWREFDLSGSSLLGAVLRFHGDFETESNYDYLRVQVNPNGVDPKGNGTVKYEFAGTGTADTFKIAAPLDGCLTSTCSIAFQFDSDGSFTKDGAAVGGIEIFEVTSGATATHIIDGTSMATPHVAGIAALAWAYKPGSSYSQVRDAILQGGDSVTALSGKTTTGREADAYGTLATISQPAAVADFSLTTTEGSKVSKSLSASDPEGDSVSWSIASNANNGTASVDSSGQVEYTPASGYTGSDSFTVQTTDALGSKDTATASVTVESSDGGGGSSGGGGGGGCTLGTKPGSPDPIWLVMLAMPWLLRRFAARRS